MKQEAMQSKNPDIIASIKALRRAARRALEIGLATGTPVWVIKNGKMVDLTKEKSKKAKRRK
jgi:hypothetical protein